MRDEPLILRRDLWFGYRQFYVYDTSVRVRASLWTPEHLRQGFARRPMAISLTTLGEAGEATVSIRFGAPSSLQSFERAIAMPFEVTSGSIGVSGPEESRSQYEKRACGLANGYYRVVVAQRVLEEMNEGTWYREDISIFLEKSQLPLRHSEILVRDDDLDPPDPLVETAEEA